MVNVSAPNTARLLAALATAACVGCASSERSDPPQEAAQRWDSAGVTIIENHRPQWAPSAGWSISDSAVLEIADREPSADYSFFRVSTAIRLDDGRIVVANTGTNEIRFFDATGTYLHTVGGTGDGPGEFRQLAWMGRGADGMIAFDFRGSRVSAFGVDGTLRQTRSLAAPGVVLIPRMMSAAEDGGLVIQYYLRSRLGEDSGETKVDLTRDSLVTALFDSTGAETRLLYRPGHILDVRFREILGGRSARVPLAIHYGPSVAGAFADGEVFVGSSDRFQIDVFDTDGVWLRSIRLAADPIPVTPEDVDALIERVEPMLSGANAFARRQLEWLRRLPAAKTMPFFSRLPFLVDDDHNLWVLPYRAENELPFDLDGFSPKHSYPYAHVFDAEGTYLGEVALPDRFRPTAIGTDYVLGVSHDLEDVERIAMYRLSK